MHLTVKTFRYWLTTRNGVIAFITIFCGTSLSITFLYLNWSEGTLTVSWAILCVLVSYLLCACAGAIWWFTWFKAFSQSFRTKPTDDA